MKKAMKQSTLVFLLNITSIILLVLVAILSIVGSVTNDNVDTANSQRYDLTLNANRFLNGSKTLTNEVRTYAATSDKTHYDNYWKEVNEDKNRDIGVQNMKAIGITEQEQKLIDDMSALSNQLVSLEEQSMASAAKGDNTTAIQLVFGEAYETEITKIVSLQAQFLDTIGTRTLNELQLLQALVGTVTLITYIFIGIVALFQIINFIVMRKRVITPIILIEKQMERLAEGDLSSHLALEADTSEIGSLVNSIHTMQKALREMVEDIRRSLGEIAKSNFDIAPTAKFVGDFIPLRDSISTIIVSLSRVMSEIIQAADQVSSGSDQLSSGAQALSQGATEQASSVEELAATITEISQQIQVTANHAVNVNQQAGKVGAEAEESNRRMQEMLTAMGGISESSSQIGKIIKTIEEIAFQTNILALNAAVEAARAGAAGKGFAVVADEVRSLASKSAEASKNTSTLIADSLQAVENGTKIADQTAHSLNQVVTGVQAITGTIEKISGAAKEQANAISQVTSGIDQISAVVQTNSATAEESAAASEELSSQAAMLKDLVGAFQLKQEDGLSESTAAILQ